MQLPNFSFQANSSFLITVVIASAGLLFGCNHDSDGLPVVQVVPDVSSQSVAAATTEIEALGLTVDTGAQTNEPSNTVTVDNVIRTIPTAGATVAVAGGPQTITQSITLPANGTQVTVVFTAKKHSFIREILVDNTPTLVDGLCIDQGPGGNGTMNAIICTESDFEIVSVKLNGSAYRPNNFPEDLADNDAIAIRPTLDQNLSVDTVLPVVKKKTLEFTFRTMNGVNDVKLDIIFGFDGKGKVTVQ